MGLRQCFGDEAADVRHELFYLGGSRSLLRAGLKALGALLRDTWLLRRRDGNRLPDQDRRVILLATLAGGSGWGSLERCLPLLAGTGRSAVVLAHPRLADSVFPAGLEVLRPLRPGVRAWAHMVMTLAAALGRGKPLLVASCLARRILWRASLGRTLAGARGVLLLHNDFDLMSCAAVGRGLPSVCLQHGIPTDEFFPTRADWYLVWGNSSRTAFEGAGSVPSRLVDDCLGRAHLPAEAMAAPEGLALLSQTHAQIFGTGIEQRLRRLANELLAQAPSATILLHPLEGQPYEGAAATASRRPPHRELRVGGCAPQLVMGYCSTAMLDAALAGHWVVALQWPLAGNQLARAMVAAPLQAESAQQALGLYDRLRADPVFRGQMAAAQALWLRNTFSPAPGGLAWLLEQVEPASWVERVL